MSFIVKETVFKDITLLEMSKLLYYEWQVSKRWIKKNSSICNMKLENFNFYDRLLNVLFWIDSYRYQHLATKIIHFKELVDIQLHNKSPLQAPIIFHNIRRNYWQLLRSNNRNPLQRTNNPSIIHFVLYFSNFSSLHFAIIKKSIRNYLKRNISLSITVINLFHVI